VMPCAWQFDGVAAEYRPWKDDERGDATPSVSAS
jgi:hypothetical protein